ncbi:MULTISPECIES: universal stress protein [unclassified Rhodococcus (in: high G+C Gram-positive bacteria)]|uniref:universal stress protein n=1 Tax=unclassified Rhodococcus (in: high G+C Gram-positive bacteria) TaxID=192944 RepID=UPI0009EBEB67|nr:MULTISPECIES: universal stress protein [unclassified Rhodococcus (in: high G+C Gram-positive bacteria)]
MPSVIVVGVDGGEASMRAARRAAEIARRLGASLHIVNAVDRGTVKEYPGRPGSTAVTSGELADAIVADAAEDLRTLVEHVTTSVVYGRPAVALSDEAARLNAELIVVGNRRTQGLSRVLGSIASAVAAHAPCDVYIAKSV